MISLSFAARFMAVLFFLQPVYPEISAKPSPPRFPAPTASDFAFTRFQEIGEDFTAIAFDDSLLYACDKKSVLRAISSVTQTEVWNFELKSGKKLDNQLDPAQFTRILIDNVSGDVIVICQISKAVFVARISNGKQKYGILGTTNQISVRDVLLDSGTIVVVGSAISADSTCIAYAYSFTDGKATGCVQSGGGSDVIFAISKTSTPGVYDTYSSISSQNYMRRVSLVPGSSFQIRPSVLVTAANSVTGNAEAANVAASAGNGNLNTPALDGVANIAFNSKSQTTFLLASGTLSAFDMRNAALLSSRNFPNTRAIYWSMMMYNVFPQDMLVFPCCNSAGYANAIDFYFLNGTLWGAGGTFNKATSAFKQIPLAVLGSQMGFLVTDAIYMIKYPQDPSVSPVIPPVSDATLTTVQPTFQTMAPTPTSALGGFGSASSFQNTAPTPTPVNTDSNKVEPTRPIISEKVYSSVSASDSISISSSSSSDFTDTTVEPSGAEGSSLRDTSSPNNTIIIVALVAAILILLFGLTICVYWWSVNPSKNPKLTALLENTPLSDFSEFPATIMNGGGDGNTSMMSSNTTNVPSTLFSDVNVMTLPGFMEVESNDFKIGKQLAQGGGGGVFIGEPYSADLRERAHGERIVIKSIADDGLHDDEMRKVFEQEVSIMYFFREDAHFAKLLGYCPRPKTILMKYYPLGSLECVIHAKTAKLTKRVAVKFSKHIAEGLKAMHDHGFAHCDLKPQNILLEAGYDDIRCVLTDFGIAQITRTKRMLLQGFESNNMEGASFMYAAPELFVLLRSQVAVNPRPETVPPRDLFSLGILISEMISRQQVFAMYSPK